MNMTEDQCTCPAPATDKTSKSWTQRIKERFLKPSRMLTSSSDTESKESEEEEEVESESSRSSSGIGSISTRSKFQQDEAVTERNTSPCVSDSQPDGTKSNVWISKTNPGVFSKLKKSTADLYDKISIAENDDQDFDNFSNNDDIEEDQEMRVKDWHIDINEEVPAPQDSKVHVIRKVTLSVYKDG